MLHLQVGPSHSGNAQNGKVHRSEPLSPVAVVTMCAEFNLLHYLPQLGKEITIKSFRENSWGKSQLLLPQNHKIKNLHCFFLASGRQFLLLKHSREFQQYSIPYYSTKKNLSFFSPWSLH